MDGTNLVMGFAGSSVDLNINLLKQRGIRDFINTRGDLFVKWGVLVEVSHCIDSDSPCLFAFVPLPYRLCSASY